MVYRTRVSFLLDETPLMRTALGTTFGLVLAWMILGGCTGATSGASTPLPTEPAEPTLAVLDGPLRSIHVSGRRGTNRSVMNDWEASGEGR